MAVQNDLIQNQVNLQPDIIDAYFGRLLRIFDDMEWNYRLAARFYGFECHGCADNCCQTRFYHHTYIEYRYIRSGIETLDPQKQNEVQLRAQEVYQKSLEAQRAGMSERLWCPLNFEGKCILYNYRPMICRLHGIPYQLQKPGQRILYGPGCGAFDDRCREKAYFKFDRTPFYFRMAQLENDFKRAVGLAGRIKMTIAEMIADKRSESL